MVTILIALIRPLLPLVVRLLAVAFLIEVPAILWVELVDPQARHRAVIAFLQAAAFAGLLVLYLRHRAGLFRRWRGTSPLATSQGSAHWGDATAIRADTGLILGRLGRDILRLDVEGHVLTIGPTGSGKGVSVVVPNLLSYGGSVLVTDPKGENFAITARRRRALGSHVFALDPFALAGGTATVNPLDGIDPDTPDAVDDAMRLAEALVVETGRESSDATFWNEEAKGLLTGLLLHVASTAPTERRTLRTVWDLLSSPPRDMISLWSAMAANRAADGAVARASARFRQKSDRVRAGILAQVQSHTHFLESPRLTACMQRSSFHFEALKREALTLYLIVPPHRLDVCRRWLRLMVSSAVHALEAIPGRSADRVLLLLDEFPALGRMRPIEQGIPLLRGYGVTFWLVAQDFGQLRTNYPDSWRSLHAAADVLQALGANDWETADYLSRLTGESTVAVATEHDSRGRSRPVGAFVGSVSAGHGTGHTERARRLLTADEVRRLPRDRALLFVRGTDPLCVERVDYRTDPVFRGQFDANPLHQSLACRGGFHSRPFAMAP